MITPLTVRLDNADGGTLMITRSLADLSFKSITPGGFASVQATLKRPLDKAQIAAFSTLTVFDGMTGEVVGGGRILDPGRSNGDGGEVSQITCIGEGLASMGDRTEPYMLIDSGDDQWEARTRSTKRVSATQGQAPTSAAYEGLFFNVEEKTVVDGSFATMVHRGPDICGLRLGSLGFVFNSGQVDSDWYVEPRAYSSDLSASTLLTVSPTGFAWAGTATSSRKLYNGSTIPSTRPVAGIRWLRDGSDDTPVDSTWNIVRSMVVQSERLGQDRAAVGDSNYNDEVVRLHEAFVDVVARFCPRLDIENASVATTDHGFDQLMWLSGISPLGVMEEMLEVEAGYTWHVWEQGTSGRWRTELVQKPTAVRYEATVNDGFNSSTPNVEVYNQVKVTWTSPAGRPQVTVVTASVPSLDTAGITRSATIALGTEKGSAANATKAGLDFLADHAVPPNAGTLTVSAGTRIRDNFTGRLVRPWHIRPNELVRVRGVQPTPTTLNATSPDGVTVFRIVSNEYSDRDAASTLELDDFEHTESRAIAKLTRARKAA